MWLTHPSLWDLGAQGEKKKAFVARTTTIYYYYYYYYCYYYYWWLQKKKPDGHIKMPRLIMVNPNFF
jgi:hypothetical protein